MSDEDDGDTFDSGRPAPLRYYEVSAQALMLHLTDGNAFQVTDGLPKDAKLVDCGYSHVRQLFYITVESEEYEDVHEGGEIPQGEVTFEAIDPEHRLLNAEPERQP